MPPRSDRTRQGSPTPRAHRSHRSGTDTARCDSAPPEPRRRRAAPPTGATFRLSAGPAVRPLRQYRDRGVGDLDHGHRDALHRQADGEGRRIARLAGHVAAVGGEEGGPTGGPPPPQLVGVARGLFPPPDVISLGPLPPPTRAARAAPAPPPRP